MIQTILGPVLSIIDKVIPDASARQEAKLKILEMAQTGELRELEMCASITEAETKSEHWLTSTWRPITMMSFTAIVVNNYIIAPYLHAMFGWNVTLEIPDHLWSLLSLGLGGYVIGRSAEKVMEAWKK